MEKTITYQFEEQNTESIDGFDPMAYTLNMHKFLITTAIADLKTIRNRKVKLPISLLEDLLERFPKEEN